MRHNVATLSSSTTQNTLKLIVILLFHHIQQHGLVDSSNDFEVVKVERILEKPIRNRFDMKSKDNETLCTSRVCEHRNSYLLGGAKTGLCQCQCQGLSVYSSTFDRCMKGSNKGKKYFFIS